jgi:hypothetical protein
MHPTWSSSAYATELLNRVSLGSCNGCVVPMEPHLRLSKRSYSPLVDATTYRILIGSMRYLLHTHPNVSFNVGYLESFHGGIHGGTSGGSYGGAKTSAALCGDDHHLWIVVCSRWGGEFSLVGYSDNDLAWDIDDRRSIAGCSSSSVEIR